MRNSFSLLLFWPVLFPAAVRPSLDAGAALDLDGSLALLRRSLRRLRSDRSEGDFEPQDAEEAAGVSELTMYMANFTKEKCGELHEKEGKDENTTKLLEKMKDVCEEEDADQVVSKINVHVSDPFFAQFLCGGLNLFTVNEMTYTELLQCQFAGNSILGGLEDCATTARQQDAKVFALKFGLYAIKVSAIFLPLPPPLGLLVHKAADMALARLSKEAESQLEALERRMDANMRALLTEELLRLGTAQARTAEEQVQEMSILDALWSDILQNEATNKVSSKFAAAMAHASSFNRWAIIEQDLSTSSNAGTGEFLRKAIFYHPQIYHRLVKTMKIGFLFLPLRHFGTQITVVEGEVYFDTNQLVLFLFGTASHCKIGHDETSIDLGSRLEQGDLDWCANGQVASGMCYSTYSMEVSMEICRINVLTSVP